MWSLIRRDPYLRHAPLYALVAAGLGPPLVMVHNQGLSPIGPWFLIAHVTLIGVLPLLRQETFRRRFSEIQLTLPVDTERLIRARLLATLFASGAPLVILCTTLVFFARAPRVDPL